jgi:sulfite exporter TauE/SafE
MCGPLVTAVLGPRAHVKHYELWHYNFTRVFSYVVLGFILGYLSETINNFFAGSGKIIAVVAGSALVILGILRILGQSLPIKFTKLTGSIAKSRFLDGRSRIPQSLGLGIMTAFLPCMTLTPALMLAAGSGNGMTGAAAMLGFGLGTLPVMTIAPAAAGVMIAAVPRRLATVVANLFLILGGMVTVWRAL